VISKIISGGQTGVDRAALDVARTLNILHGGWCPKGRIDELGVIPEHYDTLIEVEGVFTSDKENYDTRTKYNIRDSDGTLIIVPEIPLPDKIKDGTVLTVQEVQRQSKPHLLISISASPEENRQAIISWINSNNIKILNIAGPRESNSVGIYQASLVLLENTFYSLVPSSAFKLA
jgi:ribosomal protein L7Ae-like RNA K-turn-binding protein